MEVKQQSELHGNMQRTAEMTVPLGMKSCRKCFSVKIIAEYNKCKSNKDGLNTWCRECQRISKAKWDAANAQHVVDYKLAYNQEHRAEANAYTAQYRKDNHEKVKEYDRSRKKTEKFKRYLADYHAKHYLVNKDSIIEKVKAYGLANPDKVRHYKLKNKAIRRAITRTIHDLTMLQWIECELYFDYQCAYCGEQPEKLEQDHVVALTKGGSHAKFNIVPACRRCNGSKLNHELIEWYRKQPSFSEERLKKILQYTQR